MLFEGAGAAFLDEKQSQIRPWLSASDELKNKTGSSCENIKYRQYEAQRWVKRGENRI